MSESKEKKKNFFTLELPFLDIRMSHVTDILIGFIWHLEDGIFTMNCWLKPTQNTDKVFSLTFLQKKKVSIILIIGLFLLEVKASSFIISFYIQKSLLILINEWPSPLHWKTLTKLRCKNISSILLLLSFELYFQTIQVKNISIDEINMSC